MNHALSNRTKTAFRTCEIVATLTTDVWTGCRQIRALRNARCSVEVRTDLTGEIDTEMLRRRCNGELIYSLRSAEYGGSFIGSPEERTRRILAAAQTYDLIDLELDRDLTPEVLDAVPPHRRRICWYGGGRGHVALRSVFARMATTPARLYLIAPEAQNMTQAMAPLRFLAETRRTDVTAFATGELGVCGRLLAPWFGAPVITGTLGGAGAYGVPTVEQLLRDLPFPELPPVLHLYGIVGPPGRWSRTPHIQNTAFRELGLPSLFLPMPAYDFARSWKPLCSAFEDVGVRFDGATVVAPFKEDALHVADTVSEEAADSNAANLLVRRQDGWRAYTTDPIGVVGTLRQAGVRLAGRKAAVIGCGGAGRGAAAGLLRAGAHPVMVNRGPERGRYAARLLGVDYLPLGRFAPEDYSLIVHATPVREDPPFDVDRVANDAVLVDFAYGPQETQLAVSARHRRLAFVDGWGVLEVELDRQFRLMTGRHIPSGVDHESSPPLQKEYVI
jgi:3-dehydroquinate dehydratase / shikimate dehydrogenase